MSMGPIFNSDKYEDGMTKQAFKDSTDINKIISTFQRKGTLSHLAKYEPVYGDFTDMPDLLEAQARLDRGNAIFAELPSEIRREFKQSPAAFFAFVNDPANSDRLQELLPQLAKPGTQAPAVIRTGANQAPPAAHQGDSPSSAPASAEPAGEPVSNPAATSSGGGSASS